MHARTHAHTDREKETDRQTDRLTHTHTHTHMHTHLSQRVEMLKNKTQLTITQSCCAVWKKKWLNRFLAMVLWKKCTAFQWLNRQVGIRPKNRRPHYDRWLQSWGHLHTRQTGPLLLKATEPAVSTNTGTGTHRHRYGVVEIIDDVRKKAREHTTAVVSSYLAWITDKLWSSWCAFFCLFFLSLGFDFRRSKMVVKRCSWGKCNTDSRYPDRYPGVKFIPFAKPKRQLE